MTIDDFIPPGTFEALDERQVSAIKLTLMLGEQLQREMPGIVDDYRRGSSTLDIAIKYGLDKKYGIVRKMAGNVVYRALAGYKGDFKILDLQAYEGLISGKELKELRAKNNSELWWLIGTVMKEQGKGIHAQTPEERREAIRLGHIAKGNAPWSDEEIRYALSLAQQPAYQRITRINCKKVSAEINAKYHGGKLVRKPRNFMKLFSDIKRGERYKK